MLGPGKSFGLRHSSGVVDCDLLVVGGGIHGLAAAASAARAGAATMLLDPRPRINNHNASNDESKMLRLAYGWDYDYTRLTIRASDGWRALEQETGRRIFHPHPLLLLSSPGGFADASYDALSLLSKPVARLTAAEVASRFPPFHGWDGAVLDGSAGWLSPSEALAAFEELGSKHGLDVERGRSVVRLEERRSGVRAALDDGGAVEARGAVVAAGFETPRLVQLPMRISVSRQVEFFFAPLPGMAAERFPLFAAFEEGYYGLPPINGAIKVADHRKGPEVSDFDDRPPPTKEELANLQAWLTRRIPALAEASILRHRVCLYDNTPDDRFFLGLAPGHKKVAVAAGFSGHGFKYAPAIGEDLAALALSAAGIRSGC